MQDKKLGFSDSTQRIFDNYPDILKPEEIQQILGVSRATCWKIMYSKGFPLIKISRVLRVHKAEFIKWLEESSKSEAV